MRTPSTVLPLRLAPDDSEMIPVGLVLTRAAAKDMMLKLHARLSHYASLRLFATSNLVVLLSPERAALPWSAEVQCFLRQCGPAILPIGHRLDVPSRWHDDVVSRLAADHRQSLPLLILPDEAGKLQIASLAAARPLADVDLRALAEGCGP